MCLSKQGYLCLWEEPDQRPVKTVSFLIPELFPSCPYFHLCHPSFLQLSSSLSLSLQSSVRNEVMATSHVTDEWMTLMEMSSLNCYIVRRYIATPSGVLRIYPGSLMDKAFDPTRRQWWGLWLGRRGREGVCVMVWEDLGWVGVTEGLCVQVNASD